VTVSPWGGRRRRPRGAAAQCSMRPLVVVVAGEPVELGLQVGDRDGAGLADQPAFQGLVEALHLAAGLGVVGAGVTGSDPQGVQFQLDRAATSPTRGCGEDRAVVGQQRGWEPIGCGGLVEAGDHVGGLGGHPGVEATSRREWSSRTLRMPTSVASAKAQWVRSACQRSFGRSASNRT